MMLAAVLLAAIIGQTLGPVETVWIPHFNSYCKGQKVLDGPKAGEYTVLEVLQPQPQPTVYSEDPYGFLSWLNGVRASYGLSAVRYDGNLSSWASMNNAQQQARGLGHHIMGPARRQNAAMGGWPGGMWMNSPGHREALLDPTIQWIGIAAAGAYWTFNAN